MWLDFCFLSMTRVVTSWRSFYRSWHHSLSEEIILFISLQICPGDPLPTRISTSRGGGERNKKNKSHCEKNCLTRHKCLWAITPRCLLPLKTEDLFLNKIKYSLEFSFHSPLAQSREMSPAQIRPVVSCLWKLGVAQTNISLSCSYSQSFWGSAGAAELRPGHGRRLLLGPWTWDENLRLRV